MSLQLEGLQVSSTRRDTAVPITLGPENDDNRASYLIKDGIGVAGCVEMAKVQRLHLCGFRTPRRSHELLLSNFAWTASSSPPLPHTVIRYSVFCRGFVVWTYPVLFWRDDIAFIISNRLCDSDGFCLRRQLHFAFSLSSG
jgi:hypothetical protein